MSSIWTLRRSAADAKLSGLCGGLAEHWGIDPVLVRVGWVLLTLSGGLGVVLYVAGWLLIPVQGRATALADDLLGDVTHRWSREVWVVLVVAVSLAVFALFGKAAPFGVGSALVLGGIWYFGIARNRRAARTSAPGPVQDEARPPTPPFVPHPGPPTPFTLAATAWQRRIEEHAGWSQSAAGGPAPPSPDPEGAAKAAFLAQPDPVGLYVEPAPVPAGAHALPVHPARRLPARRLRLLTLLALGLTSGALALADRAGLDATPAMYAAAALLVVGLALVAATWVGRARGLLGLGLLLVPVVVVTSILGPASPVLRWDTTKHEYTSLAQLPAAGDTQPRGRLVVDLSRLDVAEDATYSAHVGAGHLEVVVPHDANVALHYDVRRGVVQTYREELQAGADLVRTDAPLNPVAGAPTLTLDLSVDQGVLEVRS